jgi:hypothetical protein
MVLIEWVFNLYTDCSYFKLSLTAKCRKGSANLPGGRQGTAEICLYIVIDAFYIKDDVFCIVSHVIYIVVDVFYIAGKVIHIAIIKIHVFLNP